MKDTRVQIKVTSSMKRLLRYLKACVLLYNLLLHSEYDDKLLDDELMMYNNDNELNHPISQVLDYPKVLRQLQFMACCRKIDITRIQ